MEPIEHNPIPENKTDNSEEPDDCARTAHTLYQINYQQSGSREYIYGYNPMQIKKAYNFNPRYRGKGQTIAIIGAFDYPTLKNDVGVFGCQFQLPPIDLEVIYARGVKPALDAGWAMETALDVQWAYALAPEAKILCVLSASNTFVFSFRPSTSPTRRGRMSFR